MALESESHILAFPKLNRVLHLMCVFTVSFFLGDIIYYLPRVKVGGNLEWQYSRKYSISNNYLADDLGITNSFTPVIKKKKKTNFLKERCLTYNGDFHATLTEKCFSHCIYSKYVLFFSM